MQLIKGLYKMHFTTNSLIHTANEWSKTAQNLPNLPVCITSSAPQSKMMSNFSSIHFHLKGVSTISNMNIQPFSIILKGCMFMFDIVDTPFSYWRGLIVWSSLQSFSKTKESTLHVIWNANTVFLLCEADILVSMETKCIVLFAEIQIFTLDFYTFTYISCT